MTKPASPDFRHRTPDDLRAVLDSDQSLLSRWKSLTPLARNEWTCWMISAKREDTRTKRLTRLKEDLHAGKRRPCCWPGCHHRKESARKRVEA
ncbi:YdeI/OmpD-associated family protein [Erythrobacter alti]|uniref:YdeI/OmpD-associated family protein n=1 Tax=Erythrobacter alti TaxID=1896145 RepID=UPI0030F44BC3